MLFYDCQSAPSPRRVRIFIAEKGLDIPVKQVDLRNREQLGEEFRAINPDCTVPALVLEDGTVLTETIAICAYLENLSDVHKLFGEDPRTQALVLQFNSKIEQQGLSAVAECFRNQAKGFAGRSMTGPENYEQIPALAERGYARTKAFLSKLDIWLGEREYIAGDAYSIADITALVVVDMAAWIKLVPTDEQANLKRWHESVSARPSAAL